MRIVHRHMLARMHVLAEVAAACAMCTAGIGLAAPEASAAAPETPATEPASEVAGKAARLNGVLNPNNMGEGGGYRFVYRVSESECEPEGMFQPEEPALALGSEKEAVSVKVTGLEPDKTYAYCLVASNLSGETTTGLPAQTFTTLALAPAVGEGSEAAKASSTGATLEAQINANNETTEYAFEYSKSESGGKLTGTITRLKGAAPLEGFGNQTASVETGAALAPGTTYYYRVTAENAQSKTEGKVAAGLVEHFATVPTPHTEAATAVAATGATLNGTLSPLNLAVPTKYAFDYALSNNENPEGCTDGETTPPVNVGTGSGTKAVSETVSGLQPSATYTVCLVSESAFGSEVDPTVPQTRLTTLAAPPEIQLESVSNVTASAAELDAHVNPNNQATTVSFEYSTSEAGGKLSGTITTVNAGIVSGFGRREATTSTGTLSPGTLYYYRAAAENAAHEKSVGALESFTSTPEAPLTLPADDITTTSAILNGTLNPDTSATIGWHFEYGAGSGCEGSQTASEAEALVPAATKESREITGLQPSQTYTVCLVASNVTGSTYGSLVRFATLGVKPELIAGTESASNVGAFEATLNAKINAYNQETYYRYQYATNLALSENLESVPGLQSIPAHEYGEREISVTSGRFLMPSTTYYYRVIAKNTSGEQVAGPVEHFTTAPGTVPTLETNQAQGAASTALSGSVTLSGAINPQGGEKTVYHYAYIPQATYEATLAQAMLDGEGSFHEINPRYNPYANGQTTPEVEIEATPNTPIQAQDATITGLTPGASYHYALIATNDEGATVINTGQTFTVSGTLPPEREPEPIPQYPANELSSPPLLPSIPLLSTPPIAFPAEESTTTHKTSTKKKSTKCPKHDTRKHKKCVNGKHKKKLRTGHAKNKR